MHESKTTAFLSLAFSKIQWIDVAQANSSSEKRWIELTSIEEQ